MSQDYKADEKEVISHFEHVDTQKEDLEDGHKRRKVNNQLDEAAKILEERGEIEYTIEDSKRVLRKIDIYVCIPMCMVYMLQQLDKMTISQAAVFNLQEETNLQGSEYSWLTSCVYVAQLIFQPLSSYALVVFPVKYWVMFNFISWSIVTICTTAATNFTGLLIARILLGAFEATILPSFVFITQMWWTRREQSYRTVAWQIANSCAAIFGPLLAFGVGHVSSGIKPYQGIFLCMGAISLACSPIVWWLLPSSPTTARFLRKGDDRHIALDRLRENQMGTKSSKWKWNQVWETYRDPKTYMWAAMYFCTATPSGGIGAFNGLILKGFNFSSFQTTLMSIPTGAIGIVTLLIGIWLTNRYKTRWAVLVIITLFPIGGIAALCNVPRDNTGGLMASFYIAYPLAGIQPLLYSWAGLNAAGTTKRVVVFATMFVFQCAGNIVGPQLYLKEEEPYYHTGLYSNLGFYAALVVLMVSMSFYLRYLNKRQAKRRAALGLPEELEDMSIMTTEEAQRYKVKLAQRMKEHGLDEAKLYENAFDDMTDMENPAFIYVL
ncbi:allantoate transporter, putative [Cryptococcus deneoformans JEC21]|uniref:Allantoate transporter, putative n=1 Tax=Cryptococcus deneoformans (strain JEC21 / ATCC MYA-565) TaxID=214684 RepID=Q5KFK2_CRYD1|nr:allantoate transporter, putative [Cryptococcus neoformans var. neoformans JEC21]AAW44174.1 allantoate transporter, putative [Cryptococcus neoformans var. neoformans JEC21]